jgi:hypothetical protein
MPSRGVRYIVLVIRITASLTLIVVWIIRRPRQKIGGVLIFRKPVRIAEQEKACVSYVLACVP